MSLTTSIVWTTGSGRCPNQPPTARDSRSQSAREIPGCTEPL